MVARADEQQKSLLSADEAKEKLALAEAEKASERTRTRAAEEAEKKRLIEKFLEPTGVSDEEARFYRSPDFRTLYLKTFGEPSAGAMLFYQISALPE
jgi:hypothetical protein